MDRESKSLSDNESTDNQPSCSSNMDRESKSPSDNESTDNQPSSSSNMDREPKSPSDNESTDNQPSCSSNKDCESKSSSDNESTDYQPRSPSIMDRELYTDMEIVLAEEDYLKMVAKKKRKIDVEMKKVKAELSALNRRTHVVYRRELKKLEIIHDEKKRLLNIRREEDAARIEREFIEDKRKMKTMSEAEWNQYMADEHEKERKNEERIYLS